MMKTMKALLGVLLLILCGLTFAPNTALAHGEKALEPFIRMRTIQWYDVMWSKDTLNVNDEVVITGKFQPRTGRAACPNRTRHISTYRHPDLCLSASSGI